MKFEENLCDNSIELKKIDALKKHILIVDDEPEIGNAMQYMLNTEFEVHTANSSEQALKLMGRTDVDILITDIFMPDKDGLELIRTVSKKYPSIKIIAMSGLVKQMGRYTLHAAEAFGASICLSKPFSKDELMFSIYSVFS